jgi:predicted ArsR family transcriptional regulator
MDAVLVLSKQLPVSRQAVATHLGVLQRAGMVRVRQSGRGRVHEVSRSQFARAAAQLSSVGAVRDAKLQRTEGEFITTFAGRASWHSDTTGFLPELGLLGLTAGGIL